MNMVNHLLLSPNLQVKFVCINSDGRHRVYINFENNDQLIKFDTFDGDGELSSNQCAVIFGKQVETFLQGDDWSNFVLEKDRKFGEFLIPILVNEGQPKALVEYTQFVNSPKFKNVSEIERWGSLQDLENVSRVDIYNEFGFVVDYMEVK